MPLPIQREYPVPRMVCLPQITFAYVESDQATAASVQERLQLPLLLAAAACNYLHFGYSIRPFLIGEELAKAETFLKPLSVSSGLFRSEAQHVGRSFINYLSNSGTLGEAAPYYERTRPFATSSGRGCFALPRHPDVWFLTAGRHRVRNFLIDTARTAWALRTLDLDTSQAPLPAGMYFVPSGVTMRPAPQVPAAQTTPTPSLPRGLTADRIRNAEARSMATLLQAQLAHLGRAVPSGLIEAISCEHGRACSIDRSRYVGAKPVAKDPPAWFEDLKRWEEACRTLVEGEDKLAPGWQMAFQFTIPESLLKWPEPEDTPQPAAPANRQREDKQPQKSSAVELAARRESAHLLAYEEAQRRARAMGHPRLAGSKSNWGPGPRSGLVRVEYTGAMEANRRRH